MIFGTINPQRQLNNKRRQKIVCEMTIKINKLRIKNCNLYKKKTMEIKQDEINNYKTEQNKNKTKCVQN